jgi:hypothetical protein
MIRTNTLKVLRVTRERKVRIITNTNDTYEYIEGLRVTRERKVGIITNNNDTYEYIEGATSNQRKKGRNYNKYQ